MSIVGLTTIHDESQTIERAIESYGQVCDEIIALDVGSTDGAADLARDMGVEVHKHEWTVYSKANAHMLSLARGRADYGFLFSATETVELDEPLPDELIAPVYIVKQKTAGDVITRSARLYDTLIPWECPDPVHAAIKPLFLDERRELPITVTIHDDDGRRPGKLARYRDELEAWLVDHPEDAHSTYFLATTYYFLGCPQAALGLFQRRARMSSGDVQAWHAQYMAGVCLLPMDFTEGAKLMIDCLKSHPDRMEPVYTLEQCLHQMREQTAMPLEGCDLNYVNAEAYLG